MNNNYLCVVLKERNFFKDFQGYLPYGEYEEDDYGLYRYMGFISVFSRE